MTKQTDMPYDAGAEVDITREMSEAGAGRLRELLGEPDLGYVARAIYYAMEYERLLGDKVVIRLGTT